MAQQADPGTPEIDFDRITAEINEEVRRRRANGDFPPGLETELDELFSRYAPMGDTTGGFDEALEQADTLTYVHADVPVASNAPVVPYVKLAFKKMLGWYLRFLAQQTTSLGTAVVRALRLLGERVDALEKAVPAADPALAAEVRRVVGPAEVGRWAEEISALTTGSTGRVLVAECGDGTVIDALAQRGIDAYGLEPDSDLVLAAAGRGLDVRHIEVLDHLRSLRDGTLSALVLSGCVDRFALPAQRELVALAAAKLRPGGLVAVAGLTPEEWASNRSAVAADLAGGRPLNAATWAHLLAAEGFVEPDTVNAPPVAALAALPRGAASADVHNRNIYRLNAVLFPAAGYLVSARRPATR